MIRHNANIGLRIPTKLLKTLKKIAAGQRVSLSELIRTILEEAMKK
jgi:hypothetical protein